MLYVLFFLSGISGLIYQVVWVREFGNVFGNTVYSASMVVAVFMLGLGAGSYLVGVWADRRYVSGPETLLRAYAYFELAIASLGLIISLLLPRLSELSALVSSYVRDQHGWYVLSTTSYLSRGAIAIVLLTPITLLMGGTLTLLIRYRVRRDVDMSGRTIAALYGVNTVGAALGAFLTDFALVPNFGLQETQILAAALNAIAGVGALALVRMVRLKPDTMIAKIRRKPGTSDERGVRLEADLSCGVRLEADLFMVALSLALIGFAAMGMEILWFRHLTILLGGFRAVFSLLLTVILVGIGAGSLVSRIALRRPAEGLMIAQGLFVALTLAGLAIGDASSIDRAVAADRAAAAAGGLGALSALWFNARPILLEVALPALLMGFSFPLANAIIQRTEASVGRHAGVLYLSNTLGALAGSLVTGFLLLPALGLQRSATVLTLAAVGAIVPLAMAGLKARTTSDRTTPAGGVQTFRSARNARAAIVGSVAGAAAIVAWMLLPADYLIARAISPEPNQRTLTVDEGLTEVIAVTEVPGERRTLVTNGHSMSSTARLSQRYMRALAHVPLLSMDNPEAVLVIGFGVGNTTHAATLHPSIRRVEVADLSRGVLEHAGYFAEANRAVLADPRVTVYVNDGRHHLHMQQSGSYDLITLEPPPIGYAGVASLYSTEFYALARAKLKPRGYLSQWLPAYQVPSTTTLAMIRAFVEIFPQAVLLSGAEAELLLVGVNDGAIEIDPDRVAARLSRAPAVQADLQRLDLGTVREIVGMFVGSSAKLADATRGTRAVTDDRPTQEYDVTSLLDFGESVPASVVDLSQVGQWCPACFVDGRTASSVNGLDTYLALLARAYAASPADVTRARVLAERERRVIDGSAYLGAIVPESADLHNTLGIALAQKGRLDEAIGEFRAALDLDPQSAATHWHLGAALASRGARADAIEHLRRSVQLDPTNPDARRDLDVVLALDPRR